METAEEIATRLESLNRRMRKVSREQFCDIGLTPAQFRVLRVLEWCDGAVRIKDLADRLDIVPRSATSVVDDLEQLGFVERSPDPTDRRGILVRLTEKGTETLALVRRRKLDAAVRLVGELSPSEQTSLLTLLDKLVTSP